MAKLKTYTVKALGVLYVTTKVRARSEAEALRKAKQVPERDWAQPQDTAECLEGHHVVPD